MAVAFVGILIVVAAAWLWGKWVAHPQSPQALAFSTTLAAALFLITGSIGFGLQKGPAIFSDARWTGGVIWPQVNVGIAFLVAAVVCWRRALRDADRRIGRSSR